MAGAANRYGKLAFFRAGGASGIPLQVAQGQTLRGFGARAYDALLAQPAPEASAPRPSPRQAPAAGRLRAARAGLASSSTGVAGAPCFSASDNPINTPLTSAP